MRASFLLTLIYLLCLHFGYGQDINGLLSGSVVDAISNKALGAVQVEAISGELSTGTVADSIGYFSLRKLPVGLYTLKFSSLGYLPKVLNEVWIRSGKAVELNVSLVPSAFTLSEFEVGASRVELARLGTREFTVEQSLRYAATFSDPARLVTTYAGVTTSNDQANHFSVRGNSPNANKWLIEGMEVVSPNHLSGAGTPSDLPSLSGGGVNMLSTQMLARSYFRNGALDLQYGNATGGIMDMRLRRGADSSEWTLQAGLIGIDISNEGSISKRSGSSYLLNYRYSTLGLLSAMGVDLGDETIKFQDLALTLNFPIGKNGELKVFGTGGISTNDFEAPRDTTLWEVDKDSLDINYASVIGIAGASFGTSIGERSKLAIGVVYSGSQQTRDQRSINDDFESSNERNVALDLSKISARLGIDQRLTEKWTHYTGATITLDDLSANYYTSSSNARGSLIRIHSQHELQLSKSLQLELGAGIANWSFSVISNAEGKVGVRYRLSDRSAIVLRGSLRNQIPVLANITDSTTALGPTGVTRISNYDNLVLTKCEDLELAVNQRTESGLNLGLTMFYKKISDIPITGLQADGSVFTPDLSVNHFNVWNSREGLELFNLGVAELYGFELTIRRSLEKNLYWFASGSAFESLAGVKGGARSSSQWDIGFSSNFGLGKEWQKQKADMVRTLGVGVSVAVNGGSVYDNITEVRNGIPIIISRDQFPFYNRVDLRIYWKKDRPNKTGMWAIDIQNAMNTQNGFYEYYDFRSREVVTQTQLGIIPNLSYRIEF